jgi:pilus assembly protein CpaF
MESSVVVQVTVRGQSGSERRQLLSTTGPIAIGRHPSCEIQLESEHVSRQHAVVWFAPPVLRVEDQSTNGTRAGNRLLVRETANVPMDTPVVIASFALLFQPASETKGGRATIGHDPALPKVVISTGETPMVPPQSNGSETRHEVTPALSTANSRESENDLRREIHRALLEHLDLATIDPAKLEELSLRPKVIAALRRIVARMSAQLPAGKNQDELIGELTDEAVGLGPLERLIADPTVSEIMVVDPNTIFVERSGQLMKTDARFTDDERVRNVVERIVTPLGRRIDESSPLVDARLRDGSRVNAVIRPLALRGTCITIRKFARTPLTMDRLIELGALDQRMARFLLRSVKGKKNVVISGGTGSGKTTLLNVLSAAIPDEERVVTIEDAAELRLAQPHVVSLETRPSNLEGRGEFTIRDLVRNALRMRPDRIVVGECRGGEALDMLQAMNTGHDGSLTTTHANSPREAAARLETLALMAGIELPVRAIREQIASSIHLIVQQSRFSDGSRKITAIAELAGIGEDGDLQIRHLFDFSRTGTDPDGKVRGAFRATGYLPSFLGEFIVRGLIPKGESFL